VRRVTAAVSVTLLVLASVAVAEASLLLLLVVFSSILRMNLGIQLGDQILAIYAPQLPEPSFTVHPAGTIGSILFAFGCGAVAAVWQHRRWRPT